MSYLADGGTDLPANTVPNEYPVASLIIRTFNRTRIRFPAGIPALTTITTDLLRDGVSLVNFIVVGPQVAGFEAGGLIGPFAYGAGNWLDIQVTGEGPTGTVRMSVTLE